MLSQKLGTQKFFKKYEKFRMYIDRKESRTSRNYFLGGYFLQIKIRKQELLCKFKNQ